MTTLLSGWNKLENETKLSSRCVMFGNTHYRSGGTRGGAAEFKWENVRGDSSFLGACVNAPRQGRRDNDRDWFWYTKQTDTMGRGLGKDAERAKALRRLEILDRQRADADLLADALGETAESKRAKIDVEMAQLKQFLERGNTIRDDTEGARIAGLGAAPSKRHDHVVKDAKVQQEVDRQEKMRKEKHLIARDDARRRAIDPNTIDDSKEPIDQSFVHGDDDRQQKRSLSEDDDAAAQRKAAKRAKKDAKKEKKKDKKKKKSRRHDD